jgi:hypothetical protein
MASRAMVVYVYPEKGSKYRPPTRAVLESTDQTE